MMIKKWATLRVIFDKDETRGKRFIACSLFFAEICLKKI